MLKRCATAICVLAFWTMAFSADAQTIRISYSGTSGQNLPFWLTYDAGLFKKYGVPAEMLLISGGLTNIQAILANEIRFSYLGGASPIQAALQGADIVVIATAYSLMPYGLVTTSAIRSAADLKGKRAAVSRIGGIEEVAIRSAMEQLGLGPKDLTFVQAGPDALRIAAVQSGAASAAALAPPALFAAVGRGLTVLADLSALGVRYPTSVVAARRVYVAQERPAAKQFLMALIEGLHIYRQRKDYAMKVLEKYTRQSDPQILSQSYDHFSKHTPLLPLSDPAVIEAALPSDRPAGRAAKDFYDNSLLRELEQEGFVKKIAAEIK
jgi:NitT/TauT family transport system substrate-binding protein